MLLTYDGVKEHERGIIYKYYSRRSYCSGNCSGNNTIAPMFWVAYQQLSYQCDFTSVIKSINRAPLESRILIKITKLWAVT